MDEVKETEKTKKGNGGKVGAALGAASGALGTIMANPIGRWAVFQSQDDFGDALHRIVYNLGQNYDLASNVEQVYQVASNWIMANPAILPVAGGLIVSGAGALIGGAISKAKLKKKNLTTKKANHTK